MIKTNINFSGSYGLFKYILQKYKQELPYNGQFKQFSEQNCYTNVCNFWVHTGVPMRAWNSLNKDLIIAFLIGKIKVLQSLEELKEEFIQKNN